MCFSQGGYPPTRPRLRGFWNLFHYVNSSKKGLQNRHSYAIIRGVPSQILGCRQAVRHQTLTLAFVGSNPAIPAKSDPLAQLAEQLPFKQWVRGSNPRRVTKQKEVIAFGGGLFSFRWSEGIRTHSILNSRKIILYFQYSSESSIFLEKRREKCLTFSKVYSIIIPYINRKLVLLWHWIKRYR